MMRACHSLQRISLSNLGTALEGPLGEALAEYTCLTSLKLRNNALNGTAYERLGVISRCTALGLLSLNKSNVGPRAAAVLSQALESCSALTHLDLSSTQLGSEVCIHLCMQQCAERLQR